MRLTEARDWPILKSIIPVANQWRRFIVHSGLFRLTSADDFTGICWNMATICALNEAAFWQIWDDPGFYAAALQLTAALRGSAPPSKRGIRLLTARLGPAVAVIDHESGRRQAAMAWIIMLTLALGRRHIEVNTSGTGDHWHWHDGAGWRGWETGTEKPYRTTDIGAGDALTRWCYSLCDIYMPFGATDVIT